MVIIDTNIVIDHLRKQGEDSILMKLAGDYYKKDLAISVISVQELYEGRSTKEERKEEYLLSTISPLKVLSYNYEIARKAGEIARDQKELIEFADSAIAATCVIHNAQLATLNVKHFKSVSKLKIFNL